MSNLLAMRRRTAARRLVRPLRGPNGLRTAPHTPAYTTAATRQVASAAALVTALGISSPGDVIEVTADIGNVVVPSSVSFATTNVLIRPPLGTRKQLAGATIDGSGVTFAGFDLTAGFLISTTGNRSGGFRLVCINQGFWSITSATDCFFVECVDPVLNTDSNTRGDRVDVYATSGSTTVVRPVIDGCYFGGLTCTVAGQHLDVCQIEGVNAAIVDPIVRDTVFGSCENAGAGDGANSSLLLAGTVSGTAQITNCFIGHVPSYSLRVSGTGGSVALADSDIDGTALLEAQVTSISNCRMKGRAGGSTATATSTTVSAGLHLTQDPLGDLTALWPECPSSIVTGTIPTPPYTGLADASANNFLGALTGTTQPTITTSPVSGFGNCLALPGSGGARVTATAPFGTLTAFTVECRVRVTTVSVENALVGKWNVPDIFLLTISNTAKPTFAISDTANAVKAATGAASLAINTVYALRGVWDGSNIYLYVDGVKVATTAATSIHVDKGTLLTIGSGNNGVTPTSGIIDEVRISNIARSTGASYTVDSAPFTADANTLALYHLDELV